MVVIVPQGSWYRFEAPDGVGLTTTTPQPTQHLTFAIDDPRTSTASSAPSQRSAGYCSARYPRLVGLSLSVTGLPSQTA